MEEIMEEVFDLEFKVTHILFRHPESHFSIVQAKILSIPESEGYDKKTVVVKGVFDKVEERDAFKCFASWVDDKKYGRQIQAKMLVMTASSDLDGIRRFLRRFVRGIGCQTANKLVDKYGTDTLPKIKESPDNISCIKGISKEKAKMIHEQIVKSDKIESLSVFLFKNGVSSFSDIVTIYDKMGENAEDKIIANPYSICDNLSISKLPIADKVALNLGVSPLSNIRLSKLIQYYLSSHSYSSGDVYMIQDYLIKTFPSFIKKAGFVYDGTPENICTAIDYMQEMGIIVVEDSEDGKMIYLKAYHIIETKTAGFIKSINVPRTTPLFPSVYDRFFDDYKKKTGIELDDIQKLAVKNAYENRFSVLTGGPGTGKTLTINAIISFIKSQMKRAEIVLCAPTGRASKRMSEFTGMEAYTIHRLLGISGEERNEDCYSRDISADFIICDEASMIDSPLFFKLISAVSESGASLLLVGDKDQLPPVGAGLPFKDIITSEKVPTVKLEKLFRQASKSQINTNAKKILAGVTTFGENGLSFDKAKQDFFLFNTDSADFTKTLILKSIEQISALGTSRDDIVVLSPVRKGILGVEEINKMVQEHVNPEKKGMPEYHGIIYTLRVNDRVMQEVNDYDLGVFNGDIGTVVDIDEDKEELTVAYDESTFVNGVLVTGKRKVTYTYLLAGDLSLAYSTTVHKAQGSEYPVVIMPLSPMFFNLSRNILYTAITRAKSRFVFAGDVNSLIAGIKKNDNAQRRTRLAERI